MARATDSRSALAAALVVTAISFVGAPGAAQSTHVLPRESEAPIAAMLAAAELPEGCEWLGAEIDHDRVHTRYRCQEEQLELVLVHPSVAPAGASRTEHFALEDSSDASEELVRSLSSAIRASEREDLWRYVQPPPADEPETVERSRSVTSIRGGTWTFLGFGCLAIMLGGVLAWRRRDDETQRPPHDDPWPVVAGLAALWLVSLVVMVVTFRFVMDDFIYLTTATADPWTHDPELRALGVRIPFFLGTRGSGTTPFIALDLAAYVGVLLSVAALARRLGAGRAEAWLAALIVGVQPGFFELVRYASGFQQLLALALVLGTLLAFDHALTSRGRQRAGFVLMALGLALCAVFTKYATAALIVLALPLWAARSAKTLKTLVLRSVPAVVLGALMLAPLLYAEIDLVGDRGGSGQLGSNASRMALGSGALLLRCLIAAGLVLVIRVFATTPKERASAWREWLGAAVTRRSERAPFALLLLALGGVFAVPFLLNERYFKEYYVLFTALWIGVWGARAIARAWSPTFGWWRWPLALVLALMFVPAGAFEEAFAASPRNEIAEWHAEAGAALSTAADARSLRLVARCENERDTAASQELLEQYDELGEGGHGVRWAAGFDPGVRVSLEQDGERVLIYCDSESPRFRLADER